ncbi:MAG TPA: ATP-dependent zinc metalloprotease FtsH [Nocardioidaceae bacterium]|jgi:cell division protease FtsH
MHRRVSRSPLERSRLDDDPTGSGGGRSPDRGTPWRVEGHRGPGAGDGRDRRQGKGAFPPWLWFLLAGLLLVNWAVSSTLMGPPEPTDVPYSYFYEQVQAGNVAAVTSAEDEITGTFRDQVRYPPGAEEPALVTRFRTQRPSFSDDQLVRQLLAENVKVTAEPAEQAPLWQQVILGFGPTLLFILLLVWFFRRSMSAAGGIGLFGRSKARLYTPDTGPRTTFADVAGIDEVKAEVMEVVDFLKNPERYRRLGASIPKGVLLTGAPGTGKTLLARAVAGEADVPFFHLSASEFIEMIVGVGASRVRDLFDQAKKAAPSIIFIDELDAVGRSRGAGGGLSGHDEREQTLNQILTEMDGFTGNEGVVVLAATNRPEILDPALLRAGRFDRRVVVNAPDQTGRAQILRVHTRGVPLAADVDLAALATSTPGMVGADLKTLVNEAALLAAKRRHDRVGMGDFTDALEKVVLGTARHIMLSQEERERTAFHESGHALLGMITPGADRVRKVSIIPRGQSLGVTFQSPETEMHGYSTAYLRGRIIGALGGRAAEEVVYGDVTTGAESDLELVTRLARQMVGRWGMSAEIGPVTVLPAPGQEQPMFDGSGPSPATRELVDAEARRIVDECYEEALRTLVAHRESLDRLARALLVRETLEEHEAYEAAGLDESAAPR